MVDGEEDEESYASAFADSVFNEDVDDTGSKIEPGSQKENPEHVSDDDKNEKHDDEKEKKDDTEVDKEQEVLEKEKENVEIEKEVEKETTDVVKEKEVDKETTDVVKEKEVADVLGSQEFRKEQKQTSIPSPIRSPRNVSSSDKTISEELTATVPPTTDTTSKAPSTPKQKIKEVLQHCNTIVPELTVAKTNEIIKQEMPRLVKLAVDKDRGVSPVDISAMVSKEFAVHGPKMIEELFRQHMQNTTLNLYPKPSSSNAKKSSADLQQQLYQTMKAKPQDQVVDLEIWEILKAKFEKP
ncbi:hypothetical protein Tco_0529325 [Tanacetum coccineum]